jgi:hypothetical protein
VRHNVTTPVPGRARGYECDPDRVRDPRDPVGLGHVASLPRPGGNITGFTVLQTDLTAKALEILKTAVPRASRFGVLWSPTAPSYRPTLQAAVAAADKLGVELQMLSMSTPDDIDVAFAAMSAAKTGAFFVSASSLSRSQRARLAELALKYRLPSMFGIRDNVEAGGLMSYAPNPLDRRGAPQPTSTRFSRAQGRPTCRWIRVRPQPQNRQGDQLVALADEVIE